jgi:hypothetical protein
MDGAEFAAAASTVRATQIMFGGTGGEIIG